MKRQIELFYDDIKLTIQQEGRQVMRGIMVGILLFNLSFCARTANVKRHDIGRSNLKDSLPGISNAQATRETQLLFNYLKAIDKNGIIFGQHHASIEGQHWKDNLISSAFNTDVKIAVGDHPGLFGFDISRGITKFKNHVEAIYRMGGIVTYSWHTPNPVTGNEPHDTTGNPVIKVLPGGQLHKEWLLKLDTVASYFNSLEVDGIKIPVIFRPFHENTGGWFWWGATSCTPEQYIALWRMTIDYLRKQKNVQNLLIAYSPSKPGNDTALTKAMYPGDDYVDIIGLDIYGDDAEIKSLLIKSGRFVTSWAKRKNKISAITEIGIKKGLQNSRIKDWFMNGFLDILKNDPSIKMAYMLTWRNSSPQSYWVPLNGQPNYGSFINFYKDPYTLFLNDLKNVYGDVTDKIKR